MKKTHTHTHNTNKKRFLTWDMRKKCDGVKHGLRYEIQNLPQEGFVSHIQTSVRFAKFGIKNTQIKKEPNQILKCVIGKTWQNDNSKHKLKKNYNSRYVFGSMPSKTIQKEI